MNARNVPAVNTCRLICVPAHQQQQGNCNRAQNIHQRRADRKRRHQPKIRPEQPSRGGAEAFHLPVLHAKCLDDPVPGNGFVQNVLDLGELVLSAPRRAAHLPADFSRRVQNRGNEQQQHPRQLPSQQNHHRRRKHKCKKLLQEFRQHARHRELHLLDIADDRREQRARGVFHEKRRRTPQDGVIQIVPQVRDHAEPRVVHQVGSGVVEDPLQYRGRHQRKGDHRPWILKVRRNQLLEVKKALGARQSGTAGWLLSWEPGFNTRSKIGPISRTRPASSSPTSAINTTDARKRPPVGQNVAQQRGSDGRGLADVPSLLAPATVEVAMRVKLNSTCDFP